MNKQDAGTPVRSQRLLSLDAFRGIAVAAMILVNCPGGETIYAPFRHSRWHGCTPADLIFPAFLMIMGVSLALSLGRRRDGGASKKELLRQAALRGAFIIGLGLLTSLVASGPGHEVRFTGVLQRIGVAAIAASWIFLWTSAKTQALIASAILVGYWALLSFFPVPGELPGDFSPKGNLASYLDRWLLGRHMAQPTSDPEGLLSTIPALATVLLGLLAGHWIRARPRHTQRAGGILLAGLACALIGWIWGFYFPINKELWTSSFALYSGGLALCGLALCYWTVEIRGLKGWARPFLVLGRNALLCYFLSELIYGLQEFVIVGGANLKQTLCSALFETWLPARAASLAYAAATAALLVLFMEFLYRNNIFMGAGSVGFGRISAKCTVPESSSLQPAPRSSRLSRTSWRHPARRFWSRRWSAFRPRTQTRAKSR